MITWRDASDPWIGAKVANFTVCSPIGRGGMGAVYLMKHELEPNIRRVLKVIAPDHRNDPTMFARFEREAATMAMLRHDHIVGIEDLGYLPGLGGYIVMPYLRGETLAEHVASSGPLEEHFATMVMLQVLLALETAHDANVIHRDLKPENIFLERRTSTDHHVVVLDFGIASWLGTGQPQWTETGTSIGTPGYMAPERFLGREVSPATDIFSAAVVLFEILSGSTPWSGAVTSRELCEAQRGRPVRPARIRDGVFEVLSRGLAFEPRDRWGSAKAFAIALANAIRANPEHGLPGGVELLARYARPFLRDRGHRTVGRERTIAAHREAVPAGLQWQSPGLRTLVLLHHGPLLPRRKRPRSARRSLVLAGAVGAVLGASAAVAGLRAFTHPVALVEPPMPSVIPPSADTARPACSVQSSVADAKPLVCPKLPPPKHCPTLRPPPRDDAIEVIDFGKKPSRFDPNAIDE